MKKNTKKLIASLALVGVVGVGSTLAYLTATGNELTNTFTVGNGYPGGKEAVKILETSISNPQNSTESGNNYENILAGGTLTKDPHVTLVQNSVESYIVVKIIGLEANKSNLTPFTSKTDSKNENIDPQLGKGDGINDKWVKISAEPGLDGIYKYTDKLNGGQTTENIFDSMNIDDNLIKPENGRLPDIKLSVCAMQATTTENNAPKEVAFDWDNMPKEFVGQFTEK